MQRSVHRCWRLALLTAMLLAGMLGTVRAQTATAADCSVAYSVTNQWPGGFQADITITSATALSGWSLTWTFGADQQVTNAWNTELAQSGASVTARNASWNASLPAGGSQSFGFQATVGASNPAPSGFALNGTPCGAAGAPTPTPAAPTATRAASTATPTTPTPARTSTPLPPTPTSAPTATPAPATQLNFDFGPGPVESGYTQVLASTGYSSARGYGFLDPSKAAERDRGTPDNLRRDFVLPGATAFQVDLPNADYQVSYISGDAIAATAMSVRAEGTTKTLNLTLAAGVFSQQSFTIALIDGHLDLEFVGGGPRINALQIKRLPARAAGSRPTVYIAGDSTVQTYSASYAPQAGWGQFIDDYFTTDVAFVNKAIGGRSSKSFVLEGRLDEILGQIRPNDYLFVQMGHNDATKSRPERYTDPQTTYKQYLKLYLDGARQRGAIPVLITPVGRLNYKNGVFVNDFSAYTTAMKELASAENVKLIDLMSKSLAYYTAIGYNETYTLFMVSVNGTDYTHFTEKGANQIARLVSEGVREINIPISRFKK